MHVLMSVGLILTAGTSARAGRMWTLRRQVEGEFIAFANGKVTVKRESDGKVLAIPLELLSQADQEFVRSKAKGVPAPEERTKRSSEQSKDKAAADETLGGLAQRITESVTDLKQLDSEPYIKGKILVLQHGNPDGSWMRGCVPSALRARKASEVGTVILVEEEREKVGFYTIGGNAYVIVWKLMLIDLSEKAVICTRSLRGSSPPREIRGLFGRTSGDPPLKAAARFLKSARVKP